MPAHKTRCPSCGAPVDFRSCATLLIVCPFCRSTLLKKDLDLENLGKMAELLKDGSPVQLGAEGKWKGRGFRIIGRIQMDYGAGTWNEWYLDYDGERQGWLGDAQGNFSLSDEVSVKEVLPPLDGLEPGSLVRLNSVPYEVTDLEDARCVGGEGELPARITPGYETTVVDLSAADGGFATIDYGDEPPRVYLGRSVELEALSMKGLKEIEGW